MVYCVIYCAWNPNASFIPKSKYVVCLPIWCYISTICRQQMNYMTPIHDLIQSIWLCLQISYCIFNFECFCVYTTLFTREYSVLSTRFNTCPPYFKVESKITRDFAVQYSLFTYITYEIQTLTRHSWIHETDCWIMK